LIHKLLPATTSFPRPPYPNTHLKQANMKNKHNWQTIKMSLTKCTFELCRNSQLSYQQRLDSPGLCYYILNVQRISVRYGGILILHSIFIIECSTSFRTLFNRSDMDKLRPAALQLIFAALGPLNHLKKSLYF